MDANAYKERIVVDPAVMVGKPVVKGTRITVELILHQLAQGINVEELLENSLILQERISMPL